jgi:hypothetical protein
VTDPSASTTIVAADVRVGDRVRIRGIDLLVSRVDHGMLGGDLLAFVEDTDERWLKVPAAADAEVELLGRPGGAAGR